MTAVLRLVTSSTESGGFSAHLSRIGRGEATVRAYTSDVRRYALTETSPVSEHVLVAHIIAGDRELAPRTRARHLSSLAAFFDYVFADSDEDNPYRAVTRPRQGVVMPVVVPAPEDSRAVIEFQRQVDTPLGARRAAAIALMAGAGLRIAEVAALRICDVDPVAGLIRVRDGKGGKSRDVPLSAYVAEVLATYVAGLGRKAPVTDPLFSVTARTLSRDVQAAVAAAGGDTRLHPHAFRHGFATAVYRGTTDLRLLADLLGHSSTTTTQIYAHVADERRSEAVSMAI